MNHTAELTQGYLDIIFHNRNKLYGGYELRSNYPKRIKTALSILLLVCAAIAAYGMLHKPAEVESEPLLHMKEVDMTRIEAPRIPEPKVIEQSAPPAKAATVKFTPPVITPDELAKEDPPAEKNKLEQATAGNTNSIGTPGNDIEGIIGGSSTKPAITEAVETKPFIFVEQMPEFAGDMNGYLSKTLIYPPMARENNIEEKVTVQFVVNEDGSISNAKVVGKNKLGGGLEEEALRVINSMPKWKPGKQNGRAVKVYFTLPVRFVLG